MFQETRISLESEQEVSAVEIQFSTAKDFIVWCNENKYSIRKIQAKPAVLMDDDDPAEPVETIILETFRTFPSVTFATLLAVTPQVIKLRPHYGHQVFESLEERLNAALKSQRHFIVFCALACGFSSAHRIFLDGKNIGPFQEWFGRLPVPLQSACAELMMAIEPPQLRNVTDLLNPLIATDLAHLLTAEEPLVLASDYRDANRDEPAFLASKFHSGIKSFYNLQAEARSRVDKAQRFSAMVRNAVLSLAQEDLHNLAQNAKSKIVRVAAAERLEAMKGTAEKSPKIED